MVVFAGALEIPRREAADLAAAVGCDVAQGVTKTTTRKAEQLIADGFPIRIIRETDFRELVAIA